MGNCCLPIRFRRTSSAVNPKSVTLLLVGLDNSGKTTIVKRLTGEPVDTVVPTVGFSVVTLRQKACHVSIYDLGGGPQIRDIWPRYYADAHGIVFVTDAHDLQRMDECRHVLESLLRNEHVAGKPVLVLANKQDFDGALDEIDIVESLGLEKIVNEQKCPTLVELCSALNFTKRLDVGIDNGYKWLIRSIIRDYPSLNNRVLKDLARQEEENKVQMLKRQTERAEEDGVLAYPESNHFVDPFKPVKRLLHEKGHANGIAKTSTNHLAVARIPGFVEELPDKKANKIHRFTGEDITVIESSRNSCSSNFFIQERFQSDMELLNDVPNQSFKNFLVRPKSSGARLYGVKSEKKRTQRRKPLRKINKTGPSPFTDITSSMDVQPKREPENMFGGNVNPFVVNESQGSSKSMPNSRRSSTSVVKKRRHSMANGKLVEHIELSSVKGVKSGELLLDVRKLGN